MSDDKQTTETPEGAPQETPAEQAPEGGSNQEAENASTATQKTE